MMRIEQVLQAMNVIYGILTKDRVYAVDMAALTFARKFTPIYGLEIG